jgi:hypothetical protein
MSTETPTRLAEESSPVGRGPADPLGLPVEERDAEGFVKAVESTTKELDPGLADPPAEAVAAGAPATVVPTGRTVRGKAMPVSTAVSPDSGSAAVQVACSVLSAVQLQA